MERARIHADLNTARDAAERTDESEDWKKLHRTLTEELSKETRKLNDIENEIAEIIARRAKNEEAIQECERQKSARRTPPTTLTEEIEEFVNLWEGKTSQPRMPRDIQESFCDYLVNQGRSALNEAKVMEAYYPALWPFVGRVIERHKGALERLRLIRDGLKSLNCPVPPEFEVAPMPRRPQPVSTPQPGKPPRDESPPDERSTPKSSTTTLAPLPLGPAGVGIGGIGVPGSGTGGDRPPVQIPPVVMVPPAPPQPLPPVTLNTPPQVGPTPPPATPASVPPGPGPQVKTITTICQQGPEAKDDPTNAPYKCRKVAKVCQPGTKGPNCPPWTHTTDTVVCTSWRTRPEQGDVATCMPMNCNIPASNILPERVGSACGHAPDPSHTGLKSAVLPVEPLPPVTLPPPAGPGHTPAVLPPAVLPPPQIASTPRGPDHVQPGPKKQKVKQKPRRPKTYVNRRAPEPQGGIDPAVAGALIGIIGSAVVGSMRGGGPRGGIHRPGPAPRSGSMPRH